MSEVIKKIDYFSMEVADKPGEGARALAVLADAGVNLLGFSGFPRGRRAQLDFIPENTEKFKAAAKAAKMKLKGRKAGFFIEGDDRPGAIADVVRRLADAKINITAVSATSAGRGRYGALLWVKPQDVTKAARALAATAFLMAA